jgi:hypothetical protein
MATFRGPTATTMWDSTTTTTTTTMTAKRFVVSMRQTHRRPRATTTKFGQQRIRAPCRTTLVARRASVNEDDEDEAPSPPSPDDVTPSDRERFAREARREGDAYVQDKLERELRMRGKIYRAEQELDEAKDGIVEIGNESKTNIDAEAGLVRDRTSLELGMVAGELDAELAALADEAQAARERNQRVKRELEDLAEELLGGGRKTTKGARDEKPVPGSIAEMKMKMADAEADAVDKRMQATLQETQRATTYTMVLLLLGFLGFTLIAEGAYDKFFAVAGAFALVAYQSRAEMQNKGK